MPDSPPLADRAPDETITRILERFESAWRASGVGDGGEPVCPGRVGPIWQLGVSRSNG
jgi:hypothetical protein